MGRLFVSFEKGELLAADNLFWVMSWSRFHWGWNGKDSTSGGKAFLWSEESGSVV